MHGCTYIGARGPGTRPALGAALGAAAAVASRSFLHPIRMQRARGNLTDGDAHGAISPYFLLYTACTRVHNVSLNPYSCTGGMTPFVQVYTLDGSTRTSVQPASLHMYSCECRAMHTARPRSTHHSRCIAVRAILSLFAVSVYWRCQCEAAG